MAKKIEKFGVVEALNVQVEAESQNDIVERAYVITRKTRP